MNQITIDRDAGMIAYEINIIKDQANKYLLHSSIEIGRRLQEAKDMVGHGNWSKWLEEEVNYSQRTASNLIKIHDEYGIQLLKNPNSQALADLGYTQAVAMLKLDVESRENFLIVHDIDEMSTRELDTEIKKVNEIKETKEELLKQIELLKGSNETLENELTVKVKDIETKEKAIKGFVKEIESLDKKVKPKADDNISAEELKKLKGEILIKKQKIIQLENELRVKPKEVEVQQIKYEIPEAVTKELDDLKAKFELI
ncbi:MAG: DUF3102 domain-containing protein [Clostridiales bacterium]|nr:DUF3102 domain-containing protein [Clostridiales bacterium]